MAMVMTAIAAVGVAAEVMTFAAIATAVAEVGMAMTIVGTITKSKELIGAGRVLSIAGGVASIGSMAVGAMSAGAEGAVEGGISVGEDGALSGAMDSAGGLPDVESLTSGDFTTGGLNTTASTAATEGAESIAGAAPSSAAASGAPGAAQAPVQAPGAAASSAQPAAGANSASDFTTKYPYTAGDPMITGISPPPATDSGSMAQWWSKQPESTKNTILQMGGKAVGGMFDGWTQEQKTALERERLNLEQQKYNTSIANANAQPAVTFKPVSSGLLNAKRGG